MTNRNKLSLIILFFLVLLFSLKSLAIANKITLIKGSGVSSFRNNFSHTYFMSSHPSLITSLIWLNEGTDSPVYCIYKFKQFNKLEFAFY